jgi:O-methyltransferase
MRDYDPFPKSPQRPVRRTQLQIGLTGLWETLTLPLTALYFLFLQSRPHPGYGLTRAKRLRLALRMWRNTRSVWTGTSYKAHLAMAAKLFEIPPETEGVVVECGSYVGGSTANLSLACDLVGRQLVVYDSFEGLPTPSEGDKYARPEGTGFLAADLDLVRENVRRHGAIGSCEFRKGWFAETLPRHREPIVLAFLDVDYQASLDDCIRNLWLHLDDKGYVFIDEFVLRDFCALFWSERYWRTHFDTTPPGLIGAGSGIGTGGYFLGPFEEGIDQNPNSVAYTRKDFSGYWDYYRDESAA